MNVLVVAPHMDDEVLGVGGTIRKRSDKGDKVHVCIVAEGYEPEYSWRYTAREKAELIKAASVLGVSSVDMLGFRTTRMTDEIRNQLYKKMEEEVSRIAPQEVYIPFWGDMHVEHSMVADACMYALRPKTGKRVRIYAYEVMSETGWNRNCADVSFVPNVFEDITDTFGCKLQAMSAYRSQLAEFPNARSLQALSALAEYRGSVAGVEKAEAFMLIREIR